MNKDSNNLIVDIIKKKAIFIIAALCIVVGVIVALFVDIDTYKAPVPKLFSNFKDEKKLKEDVELRQKDLDRLLADNKAKSEAAKNASVKDFYSISMPTGDETVDFAPLFENLITMIKENGLRMKSISHSSATEDGLIKNGGGAYTGCKVDFELVGYYPQFQSFLSELLNYPYFINIVKFEVQPYQYDKRILISRISITLYSKK